MHPHSAQIKPRRKSKSMAFTPATGLEEAKLAVLLASLLSAALGALVLPR